MSEKKDNNENKKRNSGTSGGYVVMILLGLLALFFGLLTDISQYSLVPIGIVLLSVALFGYLWDWWTGA